MADTFTVQMDEQDYRIIGPSGEEGVMVPYGDVAVLKLKDGGIFYCDIEDADEESPAVVQVVKGTKMPTEAEEVIFPETVVKAQRALEKAIDAESGTTIDVVPEAPQIN